ncbi:iron-sulfur cluster repair di-iron protein [Algoriphagus hitonicola]|uniref:Regulator of cell morphogenesis and NO signaling n=1 Tax=Algoriphagus hitonicola TaxID=435880 RepID=A0A1I2VSA8_9BACT|nr:iron-sulfur cluster repair di-iron protein [Algoriphagus hitonicola]SFG90081.1 regulator of cell morphogenesis and NO signaling [Algoriphagus hitonicola]
METLLEKKVGGIVAENFRTARVFNQYGIDFCCKGGIKLTDACEKKGVSATQVAAELEEAIRETDAVDYRQFSLSQLIDHIVTTHHKYVEDTIPALKFFTEKIEKVHGDRHPELSEIRKEFAQAADALTIHMKKEEFVLFPFIKAMQDAKMSGFPLSEPHFGHIENPIHMMEDDHEIEGDRFRRISDLTSEYTAPADACQTYRVAFSMLQEFEQDLHKHIHLENNILFPSALQLFKELNNLN